MEYAAIATAIGQATKVIVEWVRSISELFDKGVEARTALKQEAEKKRIAEILGKLQTQRYSQAPLPWLLRLAARRHEINNWSQVRSTFARVHDHVAEVLELLEAEAGPVMVECRDAFEAALFGMRDRRQLLEVLLQLPPPKSDADFEALERIAEYYVYLIEHLRQADRALASYLTEGKSSTVPPEYFGLFDREGLFANWHGGELPEIED